MIVGVLLEKPVAAGTPDADSSSAPAKTEWFEQARFGLFIHWGLYSEAAGEWQGDRYYGISEWLMQRAKIPSEDYSQLAERFNPTAFDADEWVGLAKAAGMKYIVITAKHHDGFAMFDSAVSDFDIVDATPYARDPLRALARSAAEQDIKLGFYYSQYQDWIDPNAAGNDWEFDPARKNFSVYRETKAQPQIEELLTNYGDVGMVWFDTPGDISQSEAQAFVDKVSALQPDAMVSSRVGHGLGDYRTFRDSEVPVAPAAGKPWEAIFTHNDSWGFSRFDANYKSTTDLIRLLATVAGKGGNLMLNIGPDGQGRLPEGSAKRFRAVGRWLQINGEAIYGTQASPLGAVPWGAITHRPGTLYLHVFQRPASGRLHVPMPGDAVRQVDSLADGTELSYEAHDSAVMIGLPPKLADPRNTVIRVRYEGDLATAGWERPHIVSRDFESTMLSPAIATTIGAAAHASGRYWHYFGNFLYFDWIADLKTPEDSAVWPIEVLEPGDFRVTLTYAANEASASREGIVTAAGQTLAFRVLHTERNNENLYESFAAPGSIRGAPLLRVDHEIGVFGVDTPGVYELTIHPRNGGDTPLFLLTNVTIEPID